MSIGYTGVVVSAVLTSGGVDCWGYAALGDLGNGTSGGPNSCGEGFPCGKTPAAVVGEGDTGDLGGVSSVTTEGSGWCAVLQSGGEDCWGHIDSLEQGGNAPFAVSGIGGFGHLTSVLSLASDASFGTDCAVLSTGGAACWGGGGLDGELGDGTASSSTTPVAVLAAS